MAGLGFALPIAIFLLVRVFSGKPDPEKQKTPGRPAEQVPQPQTGTPQPMPSWTTWFGMDGSVTSPPLAPPEPAPKPIKSVPTVPAPVARGDQWGHSFDRIEPTTQWGGAFTNQASADDQTLKWGSAFENDTEGKPVRWKSAFDEDDRKNIYGFEGIHWESAFPPKSSEPVIQRG